MIIGSIIIEKAQNEFGHFYLSFKDLEDPGYEYREYPDGSKICYKNGRFHREDGPALIWSNGKKEWWVNGKFIKIIENDNR